MTSPAFQSSDDAPPPGVLRWLVSCDESGTGGSPFYGFGSLWMNWQRRGDFSDIIRGLREKHHYEYEIKWNKVSDRNLLFYKDLVEFFFKTHWLHFHCIIIKQADVRMEIHGRDWDLARRKHFTMLLTNKIRRCLAKNPNRETTFRLWVDPIASRYKKADEAVEIIANNALRKVFKQLRPVDKVITRDSRETPSIQICDLLLGATLEGWQRKSSSDAKQDLRKWIARHLGWDDLENDTFKDETKFNIWYFHDPVSKIKRDTRTRAVELMYPLPTGRRTHAQPRF